MVITKHYKAWLSLAMRDCLEGSQGIDALGSPAFWVSKQIKTFGKVAKHSDGQEFWKAKYTDQFSEISPTTTAFAPPTKNAMLDSALYSVNLHEHLQTEERKRDANDQWPGSKGSLFLVLSFQGIPQQTRKTGHHWVCFKIQPSMLWLLASLSTVKRAPALFSNVQWTCGNNRHLFCT